MHVIVYLEDDLIKEISVFAFLNNLTRDSIMQQAIEEWLLKRTESDWPAGFFDFDPISDFSEAQELRADLNPPINDPLA